MRLPQAKGFVLSLAGMAMAISIAASTIWRAESQISPSPRPQTTISDDSISAIWANDGGDKVAREELRGTTNQREVHNSVWDGNRIHLFGAKNEVIAFNLILEAAWRPAI